MIVADTNIISYLFLPTAYSEKASRLYLQDSVKLVTEDKKILHEFPDIAQSLDDFLI